MKISNTIKAMALGTASVLAMGAIATGNAFAATNGSIYCPDGTKQDDYSKCGKGMENANNQNNLMTIVNIIINVLIGIIGLVAVVMIVYGGFQYTSSAGDPSKVKKAKDTILYGVIGLVISLLAFAIVNFVLTSVFGGKVDK
ncbi:MAG: pilin [Candidatus Saccharibacteria bacterium]|nr:pilin [Candidatus Saccharibacteria bacterium]